MSGQDKNSNVKWWHLLTIFGIVITFVTWMSSQVIAVDLRSQVRDEELRNCLYKYIIPMNTDISAIKMKLGINNTK